MVHSKLVFDWYFLMHCFESCYKLIKDSQNQWSLLDEKNRILKIDFVNEPKLYNRKNFKGFQDPLLKAVGLSKGVKTVLDLSIGLAIDAVFLIQNNVKVIGLERNPLIYFLLEKALENSTYKKLNLLQIIYQDAKTFLTEPKNIDVIYFDPMYPEKKKSALSKGHMQFFKDLIGSDIDSADILELALEQKVKRVVVKRPPRADYLRIKPSWSIQTKSVRFDIYCPLESIKNKESL